MKEKISKYCIYRQNTQKFNRIPQKGSEKLLKKQKYKYIIKNVKEKVKK